MVETNVRIERIERIDMMFKFMAYDALSDAQHDLIASFESQYEMRGSLSDRQFEILSDIFKKANEA